MTVTPDKITYSRRKSISIKIDEQGQLLVKAPNYAKKSQIDEFLAKKESWILKTQAQIRQNIKNFNEGEQFLYMGKNYSLIFSQDQKEIIKIDTSYIIINAKFKESAGKKLEKWYKNGAKKHLKTRLDILSKEKNLPYKKFRMTGAKTRWGSCSYQNNINLNWKLIMAPTEVIDYVILHELAHTKVKDHSKNFWDFMEELDPNYKKNKKWLNVNQHKMSLG